MPPAFTTQISHHPTPAKSLMHENDRFLAVLKTNHQIITLILKIQNSYYRTRTWHLLFLYKKPLILLKNSIKLKYIRLIIFIGEE